MISRKHLLLKRLTSEDRATIIDHLPKWEGDLPEEFKVKGTIVGWAYRGKYVILFVENGRVGRKFEGSLFIHPKLGMIAIFKIRGKSCYLKI